MFQNWTRGAALPKLTGKLEHQHKPRLCQNFAAVMDDDENVLNAPELMYQMCLH